MDIVPLCFCCWRSAEGEPQRVASIVLHLVPAARRIFRAQHVRRRRRRELPQVSREQRQMFISCRRREERVVACRKSREVKTRRRPHKHSITKGIL